MKKIEKIKKINEDFIDSYDDEVEDNSFNEIIKDSGLKARINKLIKSLVHESYMIDSSIENMMFVEDIKINGYWAKTAEWASSEDKDYPETLDFKKRILLLIYRQRTLGEILWNAVYNTTQNDRQALKIGTNIFSNDTTEEEAYKLAIENITDYKAFFEKFYYTTISSFKSAYTVGFFPENSSFKTKFIATWLDHWEMKCDRELNNYELTPVDNAQSFTGPNMITTLPTRFYGRKFVPEYDVKYVKKDIEHIEKYMSIKTFIEVIKALKSIYDEYLNPSANESLNEDFVKSYDEDDEDNSIEKISKEIAYKHMMLKIHFLLHDTYKEIKEEFEKTYSKFCKVKTNCFYHRFTKDIINSGKLGITADEIKKQQQEYFKYRLDLEHSIGFLSFDFNMKEHYGLRWKNHFDALIALFDTEGKLDILKKENIIRFPENVKDMWLWFHVRLVNPLNEVVEYLYNQIIKELDAAWNDIENARNKFGYYAIYFINEHDKEEKLKHPEMFLDMIRTDVKNLEDHEEYKLYNFAYNKLLYCQTTINSIVEHNKDLIESL